MQIEKQEKNKNEKKKENNLMRDEEKGVESESVCTTRSRVGIMKETVC